MVNMEPSFTILICPEIPFDGLAQANNSTQLQKEVVGFKWGAKGKG